MFQFNLRSLMVLTTIFCILLAAALPQNQPLRVAASVIIGANILSAIAAILVTHVFGLPRDGGYRHRDSDDE